MSVFLRVILPVVAILVAGYFAMKLLSIEPEEETKLVDLAAMRGKREKIEVNAVRLERVDYQVFIASQGVVREHNSASLTPRVSGRVIRIHENFESGAFFKNGEVLLELDPADYESAVASAEAAVARADAALAQEEARAEQALLDWQALGYTDEPGDLVLRKPQLKEAEANVKAALASLAEARRDLENTRVVAPYDGCVLSREVGPGQSVNTGTMLGGIFSTDYAEIRLPLSSEDMRFITLANGILPGEIPVTLSDALDPDGATTWQGQIVRSEGVLDESSRELFVIARVEDPYGLRTAAPPLRIGQPVAARIRGNVIPEVFIVPRSSLRSANELVLVNPEDSLVDRRRFTPLWSNEDELIVSEGLEEDWWLVTSGVSRAPQGAEVKVVPAETPVRVGSGGPATSAPEA